MTKFRPAGSELAAGRAQRGCRHACYRSPVLLVLCAACLCPAVPADKTIFEWQAMTEDEQRARLEQIRLEVAAYGEDEEVV